MNNRVDYLSDKLVNLRGKLKHVEEVVPRDSLVNGVTAVPSSAKNTSKNPAGTAYERRREQTCQLYNDLEQRLIRRLTQVQLKTGQLNDNLQKLEQIQQQLKTCIDNISAARLDDSELTAVQLGERYRLIDQQRLAFFELDAELEMLMNNVHSAGPAIAEPTSTPEGFRQMLKAGMALALTLGSVIFAAIMIGACLLYLAWR